MLFVSFFVKDTATTEIYTYRHTLSLHDALPISRSRAGCSWRSIPIEIDRPSVITATGSASGSTRARAGTVTRFMPKPSEPWMVAPTKVAGAATTTAPIVTSTRGLLTWCAGFAAPARLAHGGPALPTKIGRANV